MSQVRRHRNLISLSANNFGKRYWIILAKELGQTISGMNVWIKVDESLYILCLLKRKYNTYKYDFQKSLKNVPEISICADFVAL